MLVKQGQGEGERTGLWDRMSFLDGRQVKCDKHDGDKWESHQPPLPSSHSYHPKGRAHGGLSWAVRHGDQFIQSLSLR